MRSSDVNYGLFRLGNVDLHSSLQMSKSDFSNFKMLMHNPRIILGCQGRLTEYVSLVPKLILVDVLYANLKSVILHKTPKNAESS